MTQRPQPAGHPTLRTRTAAAVVRVLACAVLAAAGLLVPVVPTGATAGHDRVDPATLPLGAPPAVAHLVRDTIVDGPLRIPATTRGRHDALWVVSGGYVVRDYNVGPRRGVRVVLVGPTGARRVIARSRQWVDVEVSPDGDRVALRRPVGPTAQRSVVTVEEPASGRVLWRRELRLATLVAVTTERVLLAIRARWHDPATVWWSLDTGRMRRLHDQAAVAADVSHDRVVFLTPRAGEFCNRVARLSDPGRTLWRSCRTMPHQWSHDGRRALSTWAYFDAAGTDRWWVVDGRTADREATITGRLDWHAVWEDSTHFLVNAQGDTGQAAVLRCDLQGACERASKLWDTPLPTEPSLYYRSPPVVLAEQ